MKIQSAGVGNRNSRERRLLLHYPQDFLPRYIPACVLRRPGAMIFLGSADELHEFQR